MLTIGRLSEHAKLKNSRYLLDRTYVNVSKTFRLSLYRIQLCVPTTIQTDSYTRRPLEIRTTNGAEQLTKDE